MRLLFSMEADGAAWPDFPGAEAGAPGAVGAETTGPAGLLSALETMLGLGGPAGHPAPRIAAYARRLSAHAAETPDAFFAVSLAIDPWETARRVLELRDILVEAGWRGAALGEPRLETLAAVEARTEALPRGLADRLAEVTDALAESPAPTSLSVELAGGPESLPPGWRRLLDRLAAGGAEIRALAPPPAAAGDLGRAQARLAGAGPEAPVGDGSLRLLRADNTLAAAEALAEHLATRPKADLAGTLILSETGDLRPLDAALGRAGLPRLGLHPPEAGRGLLRILPLAFETLWRPLDPQALFDFATLPVTPMPQAAARRVSRHLARRPGAAGPEWDAVLAEIAETLRVEDRDPAEALAWLDVGRVDRAAGLPLAEAVEVCTRVARRADALSAASDDPLAAALGTAARAASEALTLLGVDPVDPVLLRRVVAQALGPGAPDPARRAEAGPLRAVAASGAVLAPADTLVWWNFAATGGAPGADPWSRAERAALATAGLAPETPGDRAARAEAAAIRAARMARRRLILVSPIRIDGEPAAAHPLEHRLRDLLHTSEIEVRAEALLDSGAEAAPFALDRRVAPPLLPPKQVTTWRTPAAARAPEGLTVGVTTVTGIADCPLRWTLKSILHLSDGRPRLQEAHRQQGDLVHALAAEVFRPGPPPPLPEIEARVDAAFDGAVAAVAGSLALPEHVADLARIRRAGKVGFAALAELAARHGLDIVATEADVAGEVAPGVALRGRLDLMLAGADGRRVVADHKWTSSARRYETEIEEGRAVQLAAYGALAGVDRAAAEGAYVLVAQGRVLGPEGGFADVGLPAARTPAETWAALSETVAAVREEIAVGELRAAGLGLDERPDLPLAANDKACRYCDFRALCRVEDPEAAP